MQANLNKVLLIGRLTKDVVTAYSQSNQARINFSVATERRWKDKQTGEWTGETEFSNCVHFGQDCQRLENEMHQGASVYVEGYLKTREYENKQQQKVKTTEIVAERVMVLAQKGAAPAASQERKPYTPPSAPKQDFDDTDLPFS